MIIPNSMISHIGKIWDGEYNIPLNIPDCKVLDIGANIGGFAVWVCSITDYQVTCYEPIKSNFELLEKNTKGLDVYLHNFAVTDIDGATVNMFLGKNNCGEASLYKGDEQSDSTETAQTIDAARLPNADIVKIDTEGAEVMILKRMTFRPIMYLIEYHSESNRSEIHEHLKDWYDLIQIKTYRPHYGVVSYLRKDYV